MSGGFEGLLQVMANAEQAVFRRWPPINSFFWIQRKKESSGSDSGKKKKGGRAGRKALSRREKGPGSRVTHLKGKVEGHNREKKGKKGEMPKPASTREGIRNDKKKEESRPSLSVASTGAEKLAEMAAPRRKRGHYLALLRSSRSSTKKKKKALGPTGGGEGA